jgi:uncharacterized protein YdeI (BOF family)
MGRWLVFVLVSLLVACQPEGSRTLGLAPDGLPETVAQLKRSPSVGRAATVAGEIIEKCPVAGCWFMLRDDTGVIKVDTKSAGFVVLEIPLHTRVRVAGRLGGEGSEKLLEATGLRY